jgi:nucleoside-diphosphate-sugar epimerase
MPRIFNVGGPYITSARNYALGDFIAQARETGAIAIGARRPVLRSYVHVLELARVTFALALDDGAPETFDTGGPEIIEMTGLAEAVGRALDLPDLEIVRPLLESDTPDRYVGDGRLFQETLARLGGQPVALEQIIRDTAAWMAC